MRNDIARSWILIAIFSAALSACSASLLLGPACQDGGAAVDKDLDVCSRSAFGIIFGVLGLLFAVTFGLARSARSYRGDVYTSRLARYASFWSEREDQVSFGLSALALAAFAVNAGLLTGASSGWNEPCDVHLASWICLALGLHLMMRQVEMWSTQPWIRRERGSMAPNGHRVNALYVPLGDQQKV